MSSILIDIRTMLGPSGTYEHFDTDLIANINACFAILCYDLGVGPETGFRIDGTEEDWTDFIPDDDSIVELVKTFIYMRTKLVFDPPQHGALLDSYKRLLDETTWRLNEIVETRQLALKEGT